MKKTYASLWVSLLVVGVSFSTAQAQIETNATYAYMEDFDTGTVLMNKGGDVVMHPSSMSKLMTSYVVYEQIKQGKLKFTDTFPVSEKAWKMGGSKMFVHVGDQVKVEDLIRGVVTQSGNDACVVLAEGIAGSEEAFALMMNETAKRIGLTKSHFVNATGWPDEEHVMSAQDLAILARRIINDFPDEYKYYSEKEFTYNGITQPNRNRLLGSTLGVDGLKTGHTELAGYGITLSAKDASSNRRVILVINGLQSDDERVAEGAKLLGYGLKAFENKTIVEAGKPLTDLPVWFGSKERVSVVAEKDVVMTLPKATNSNVRMNVEFDSPVKTPIQKGQQIATLSVTIPNQPAMSLPLVASDDVAPARGISWIKAFISQFITNNE